MDFLEKRSQFCVYLLNSDVQLGAEDKLTLSQAGYEVEAFVDVPQVVSRVQEQLPHVILFSVSSIADTINEFFEQIQAISVEIRFIAKAAKEQLADLEDYKPFGLVSWVAEETSQGSQNELLWTMDLVCNNLYLQYQNEQLFESWRDLEKQMPEAQRKESELRSSLNQLQSEIEDYRRRPQETPLVGQLLNMFIQLSSAKSKDELLTAFVKQIGSQYGDNLNILYFKFLPTVYSLVATQAHGLTLDAIKGVGCKLEASEVRDYRHSLSAPGGCASLKTLMQNAFRVEQFRSQALPLMSDVDGVMVLWGSSLSQIVDDEWKLNFAILRDFFERFHLRKKVFDFEVKDELTQLYNLEAFVQKLEEEVSRSRRLQLPVGLIKMSIDKYAETQEYLGELNFGIVVKSIASIVKKTSRVNDIICRTGETELTLILPHSGRKGAAIRAERLRRIVETTSFAIDPVKITASFGVSEYPSLSKGAEDLVKGCSEALQEVSQRGGNKVCLAGVPKDFKPDFDVPPV